VLYQALRPVTLPPVITPPLIGSNQTPEERILRTNTLYVYDKKEDKNFPIPYSLQELEKIAYQKKVVPTLTPTLSPLLTPTAGKIIPIISSTSLNEVLPILWHPDSKHLGILQEKEIIMIDYDGTNKRTVYSGPFEKDFFLVTRDGSLTILTNLNPQYNQYADLYDVGIR
jgi:hypothetical protein